LLIGLFVATRMQPGAGPFRASNNRETYRKELIAELTIQNPGPDDPQSQWMARSATA
jgi:hypothetical protein